MQLSTFFVLYGMSVVVFAVIDFIWLGFVAKNFYQERLGHLLGDVNWVAAVIFYLLFLVGLTIFATYPAVVRGTIYTALTFGALFGFFTYVTYDLTNLATLRDWPIAVVLVDIAWGTFISAAVAGIVYYLYTVFFR